MDLLMLGGLVVSFLLILALIAWCDKQIKEIQKEVFKMFIILGIIIMLLAIYLFYALIGSVAKLTNKSILV